MDRQGSGGTESRIPSIPAIPADGGPDGPAREDPARDDRTLGPDGSDAPVSEGITAWLRRVRRRVFVDRCLGAAVLDLGISLSLLAVLLLADRTILPGLVSPALALTLLFVSVAVSALRTILLTPLDLFSMAVLADGKLGLKERVSTTLYLWREPLPGAPEAEGRRHATEPRVRRVEEPPSATVGQRRELGRLVCEDAWTHLRARSVSDGFPVRLPRRWGFVSIPLLACVGLALWLPSFDVLGLDARRRGREEMGKAVAEEKKQLAEDLAKLELQAREREAREIEKLLASMRPREKDGDREGEEAKPSEGGSDPKKETLLELTRMEDILKDGLRGADHDRLRKTLAAARSLDLKDSEPTRRLREGLKDGDLAKAREALEELRDAMSRLAKAPDADRKDAERKDAERKGAQEAELRKLQKLREELQRLARELGANAALSEALSRASASLPSLADLPGGLPDGLRDGMDGLQDALDELDTLERLSTDLKILEQALEAMRLAKDRLAALKECPTCGTPRCPDCGKPRCACASGARPGAKPGGT